ncbi:bifunctional DNA-formamidopyrimidine glycosylase/DNA-(apurinic or apyrimidinic site) lyase [Fluviispira vulneris]|uniref:bifunctional DNA-formamidopyrimidine glycosylase/DNA-(apurinic or apyrimidinic site) lyase n=1 Tax=Fluviispira vulneris TaxID=2763012 RepID=UPI00164906FF|nr:bifunctional DNA-formamidopyrimidine glycosylase/DNA-(apurinic or apyrimidinic site) lyase [Fluviispira vulneris]
MPELPEVQNFAQSIHSNYVGKKFKNIVFHRDNLRYPFEKEKLERIFASGNEFLNCYREGKQIILETSSGAVKVSLGMTGAFKAANQSDVEKHQHVTLNFKNGESLAFVDPRRFGFWKICESNEQKETSCDPLLEKDLLKLFLSETVKNKNISVKDMLMDQKLIGGIGNIYALEALFLAGILPTTRCVDLSILKWKSLAKEIPIILNLAINLGGSSISTYRSFKGDKGSFQNLHKVYGRENEKCLKSGCQGYIKRIAQSGRSSWFCPVCQF